jgi:predicted RNase H-like nuclease
VVATSEGATFEARLHRGLGTTVGIDMPIGLPDHHPRASDREARAFLGARRSSIFTTPPRACLAAADYPAALAAARAAMGVGISVQSYHLLAKIRELDALVQPGESQFVEIHPECAFLLLNDHVGLPSKSSVEGAQRRTELLARWYGPLPPVPRGAKPDDLLDALAVLWSVHRYVDGEHRTFGDGAVDARGLPMRVVC